MKKILLVQAADEYELANWNYGGMEAFFGKRAGYPPLGLATIAGMAPDTCDLSIWDEHVKGQLCDGELLKSYDLIGITAFSNQLSRAIKIAALARSQGVLAVIGGPAVTATPGYCRHAFDILFPGEAERTWPRFLDDWFAQRRHSLEYRDAEFPDLSLSPIPRWQILGESMQHYMLGSVQVTRGCPFNCEFCSVWGTFGRKVRTKPLAQVESEIRLLKSLGVRSILLVTDNLVGDPRYTKDLLQHLIELNASFDRSISYTAELDISVARNDTLLELLAEANFMGLFIGIETPNRDSLAETRKRQNLRGDLPSLCRHIQSYGLPIDGSLVVGFDHDTPDTFEQMFDFVQDACIMLPKLHLLIAVPDTELYRRLVAENRLFDLSALPLSASTGFLDSGLYTNILPLKMSRSELIEGYAKLLQKIHEWPFFEHRMRGFLSGIQHPAQSALKRSADGSLRYFQTKKNLLSAELRDPAESLFSEAKQYHAPFAWMVMAMIFRYQIALNRVQKVEQEIDRLLSCEARLV